MALTLNLNIEDVGPGRTRAVLALIEAVMLFPGDSDSGKQQVVAYSGAAESYLQAPACFAGIDIQRWLRAAPHIEPLQAEIRRRFIIGLTIGRVVIELFCDKAKTLRSSLTAAENRFNAIRGEDHPPLGRLHTNWWPHFRLASHLWAASYSLDVWTPNRFFPCALRDLPEFLAVAEYFRFLAEQHTLKGTQGKRLLSPGQAYGVPLEVAMQLPVPPVAVRPGRLLRVQEGEVF